MKRFLILLLVAALLLQGCAASKQTWYKQGGTQREFDTDAKECGIIAKQQALLDSENGDRINPLTYADHYQHCIISKGWSTVQPVENLNQKQAGATSPLAVLHDNQLDAFGHRIELLAGTQLQSKSLRAIGPTKIESFFFKTADDYLNILLQQSDTASFQSIDYPVKDTYGLYTSGVHNNVRWSAFWGKIGEEWVKGIGSFLLYSSNQRAIVVITGQLAPPEGVPPEGLLLTANQQQEMQQFVEQWQPWLEAQSSGPTFWQRGAGLLWGIYKPF